MAEHGDETGGFHGPRCWAVSALVGVLLGYLLTFVVQVPAPTSAAHQLAEAPLVIETRPDGSRALRMPQDGTIDLRPNFDATNPADIEQARKLFEALASGTVTPTATRNVPLAAHPEIPLVLCLPFAALLLSIAVMPFLNEHFWHRHFPDFAFFLGAMVATFCVVALGGAGKHMVVHAAEEYYAFIALVGGLYVASGGILIDIRTRGRPITNTALLALGAGLANIVGTTGASVLLIRPFMRMNRGRLRPLHVVFFIFIVSNCAGCLTPIGDPPLYLGFLKGVPFFWTLEHMWPMWLFTNGLLLGMFYIADSRIPLPSDEAAEESPEKRRVITGFGTLFFLALLVAGVFIDPLLKQHFGFEGFPIGATFQLIIAAVAYLTARPSVHNANRFTFGPVKEVGFLFIGIFLTMAPALEFLRSHAGSLGLETPGQFYFGTGFLSAVLDNAPTYLSFLQVSFGVLHIPLTPDGVREFIASTFDLVHVGAAGAGAEIRHFNGLKLLEAISLGAVLFGAMTYIGNGPNFMVKSIVESTHKQGHGLGVRMPSFVGYLGWAVALLLPVLLLNWLLFIR